MQANAASALDAVTADLKQNNVLASFFYFLMGTNQNKYCLIKFKFCLGQQLMSGAVIFDKIARN